MKGYVKFTLRPTATTVYKSSHKYLCSQRKLFNLRNCNSQNLLPICYILVVYKFFHDAHWNDILIKIITQSKYHVCIYIWPDLQKQSYALIQLFQFQEYVTHLMFDLPLWNLEWGIAIANHIIYTSYREFQLNALLTNEVMLF